MKIDIKKILGKIKELPKKFMSLPIDEKIAYIILCIGILLFFIALLI